MNRYSRSSLVALLALVVSTSYFSAGCALTSSSALPELPPVPVFVIVTTAVPQGFTGTPYPPPSGPSVALATSGGTPPVQDCSVVNGILPGGLRITPSGSQCLISGTINIVGVVPPLALDPSISCTDRNGNPVTAATLASATTCNYTFTLRAADSTGIADTQVYTMTVRIGFSLQVLNYLPGVDGRTYSAQVPAAGGTLASDLTSCMAMNLPPGLSIEVDSTIPSPRRACRIFGTVGASASAGSPYMVTVTANDPGAAGSDTQVITLPINPRVSVPLSFATDQGTVGRAFLKTIMVSGGNLPLRDNSGAPLGCSATNLPPGLSIDRADAVPGGSASTSACEIFGMPTTSGTFSNIVVTVTDQAISPPPASGFASQTIPDASSNRGGGDGVSMAASLVINAQLTVPAFVLGNGTEGRTFSQAIPTTNGNQPLTACSAAVTNNAMASVTLASLGLMIAPSGSNCVLSDTGSGVAASASSGSPYSIVVTATDTASSSTAAAAPPEGVSAATPLVINRPLSVPVFALANGTEGQPYNATIPTTNGNQPLTACSAAVTNNAMASVTPASLGLMIAPSGSNCVLSDTGSGVAASASSGSPYSIVVTATDTATTSTPIAAPPEGVSAATPLAINGPLVFTTTSISDAVNSRSYEHLLLTSGGEQPLTSCQFAGGSPPTTLGVQVVAGTNRCRLFSTSTITDAPGLYNFTVRAIASPTVNAPTPAQVDLAFSLRVRTEFDITQAALVDGVEGRSYGDTSIGKVQPVTTNVVAMAGPDDVNEIEFGNGPLAGCRIQSITPSNPNLEAVVDPSDMSRCLLRSGPGGPLGAAGTYDITFAAVDQDIPPDATVAALQGPAVAAATRTRMLQLIIQPALNITLTQAMNPDPTLNLFDGIEGRSYGVVGAPPTVTGSGGIAASYQWCITNGAAQMQAFGFTGISFDCTMPTAGNNLTLTSNNVVGNGLVNPLTFQLSDNGNSAVPASPAPDTQNTLLNINAPVVNTLTQASNPGSPNPTNLLLGVSGRSYGVIGAPPTFTASGGFGSGSYRWCVRVNGAAVTGAGFAGISTNCAMPDTGNSRTLTANPVTGGMAAFGFTVQAGDLGNAAVPSNLGVAGEGDRATNLSIANALVATLAQTGNPASPNPVNLLTAVIGRNYGTGAQAGGIPTYTATGGTGPGTYGWCFSNGGANLLDHNFSGFSTTCTAAGVSVVDTQTFSSMTVTAGLAGPEMFAVRAELHDFGNAAVPDSFASVTPGIRDSLLTVNDDLTLNLTQGAAVNPGALIEGAAGRSYAQGAQAAFAPTYTASGGVGAGFLFCVQGAGAPGGLGGIATCLATTGGNNLTLSSASAVSTGGVGVMFTVQVDDAGNAAVAGSVAAGTTALRTTSFAVQNALALNLMQGATMNPANLLNGVAGRSYGVIGAAPTYTATGGLGSGLTYAFCVQAPGAPGGLTGIPTCAMTIGGNNVTLTSVSAVQIAATMFTVQVSDGGNSAVPNTAATRGTSFMVNAALALNLTQTGNSTPMNPPTLLVGVAGRRYGTGAQSGAAPTYTAAGGDGAYSFCVQGAGAPGNLMGIATCPTTTAGNNLTLTATDGSPATATAATMFTVQVDDAGNAAVPGSAAVVATATRGTMITINNVLAFVNSAFTLPDGTVGATYPMTNISFQNGLLPPLSACVADVTGSGGFSPLSNVTTFLGLTLTPSGSDCVLTGTPSANTSTNSPYTITIKGTDTANPATPSMQLADPTPTGLVIFGGLGVNLAAMELGVEGRTYTKRVFRVGGNGSLSSCSAEVRRTSDNALVGNMTSMTAVLGLTITVVDLDPTPGGRDEHCDIGGTITFPMGFAPGAYRIRVTMNQSGGGNPSATSSFVDWTINAPLAFPTATLNVGTEGQTNYMQTLPTTGGSPPLPSADGCQVASLVNNAMNPVTLASLGLMFTPSMSGRDCVLANTMGGIPISASTGSPYMVTFAARDSNVLDPNNSNAIVTPRRATALNQAGSPLTLTINPPPLVINAVTLGNGTATRAFSETITTTGGTGTLATCTATVVNASMVTIGTNVTTFLGLTLTPAGANCTLTGTVAASSSTDSPYTVTFTVTDTGTGMDSEGPVGLVINPDLVIDTSAPALPPDAVTLRTYNFALTATGGQTPLTWTTLNSGVNSLNTTDDDCTGFTMTMGGVIQSASVPTTPVTGDGVCDFTARVTATNTSSTMNVMTDQAMSIVVQPAMMINQATLPNAKVSFMYSQGLTVTGGIGNLSWFGPGDVSPTGTCPTPTGTFPSNFGIGASNGIISGTSNTASATAADFIFEVCVEDEGNAATPAGSFTQQYTVHVFNTFAYVTAPGRTGADADQIRVVNTGTNVLASTIALASNTSDPHSVAVTPDGRFALVTLAGTGEVAVIDTITNAQITNSPFSPFSSCTEPRGITFPPGLPHAYVACGDETVAVLVTGGLYAMTPTLTEFTTITVASTGGVTEDVATTPDGMFVFVSISSTDEYAGIDTDFGNGGASPAPLAGSPFAFDTVTLNGCDTPLGMAVRPDGLEGYIVCSGIGFGRVAVIDTDSGSGTFTDHIAETAQIGATGARRLEHVAFLPSSAFAYVTNPGLDQIARINTSTLAVTSHSAPDPTNVLGDTNPLGVTIPEVPSGTPEIFFVLAGDIPAAMPPNFRVAPGVGVVNEGAPPTNGTNNPTGAAASPLVFADAAQTTKRIAHIPLPQ